MRRGGPLVAHPGRAALLGTLVVLAVAVYSFDPGVVAGKHFQLVGIFRASQGLTDGAPVRVAGYDVGHVASLSRGPGNTASVRMELDDDAPPLYAGTTLRVRPRIFLEGGFYVDLSPGVPAGGRPLHSGATIPLSQTANAVQSDQPLDRFDHEAREHVATILHTFAVTLSAGGAQQFRELTREAPAMLRPTAVAAKASQGLHPGELTSLVQNAAATSEALAPYTQELEGVVVDGDRTFRALSDHGRDLGTTIRLADAVLRQLPATLRAVDATLPVLDRYSALAEPVLDRLPRSLRSTAAVLSQSTALTRDSALPRLLRNLAPTINRLPTFEAREIPLFRFVEPVSECTTKKITPVIETKLSDGAFSTGRPAWLDSLHGLTGAAGALQNFDGNGPYLRYESGLSDQTFSTGDVPGAGTLVGLSSGAELGVRPVWNGPTPPPFHPEADCRTQAVPSLTATAAAAPRSHKLNRAVLATPKIRRLLARIAKAAGRGAKTGHR